MRARRGQHGFTMIEVLISIVLCSIAVMGVVALFRIQSESSSFSRRVTEATVLAEDKMEKLRTLPVGALAGGPEVGIDETGRPGGVFTRSWTATPAATYVDIDVTVEWNEDGPRQITLRGRRNL
jgi:prepilin-type N-terminal cleavage/methylation domain-containing protein